MLQKSEKEEFQLLCILQSGEILVHRVFDPYGDADSVSREQFWEKENSLVLDDQTISRTVFELDLGLRRAAIYRETLVSPLTGTTADT